MFVACEEWYREESFLAQHFFGSFQNVNEGETDLCLHENCIETGILVHFNCWSTAAVLK